MDILYTALKHAHSGLRWVVLILLVAAIVNAFGKRSGGTVYPAKNKLGLFALISVHVQLLLGLVLYLFLSPLANFEGDIMGNAVTRFYTVEHLVGMVIGIVLVTMGYSKAKRQAGINKGWKTIGVFYLIGLIVILASIPWPFRNLGAGWF
ncbi:cytochrome B [Neolewinella aurantiaca]|uniref:cytochrome B n=1 Tax=Neolewinella aurantiaca TaxID=2602767 RepID=UPI001650A47D|nr:cytochrome B [Neolewinella aurantiaca]